MTVAPGREALAISKARSANMRDLASDLEVARDAYLSAMESQNADAMAERREVLERMLWDDKGLIIDALCLAAKPSSNPDAMNERRVEEDARLKPVDEEGVRERADLLITTKFDEVSCKQLANCGWPECECPRNVKHSTEAVTYAFNKARELLVAAGFEETAGILHDCRPALSATGEPKR